MYLDSHDATGRESQLRLGLSLANSLVTMVCELCSVLSHALLCFIHWQNFEITKQGAQYICYVASHSFSSALVLNNLKSHLWIYDANRGSPYMELFQVLNAPEEEYKRWLLIDAYSSLEYFLPLADEWHITLDARSHPCKSLS